MPATRNVLMVHDLSARMNCDTLFNLFSLFGNVYKVGWRVLRDAHASLRRSSSCPASLWPWCRWTTARARRLRWTRSTGVICSARLSTFRLCRGFDSRPQRPGRVSKHDQIGGSRAAGTVADGTPVLPFCKMDFASAVRQDLKEWPLDSPLHRFRDESSEKNRHIRPSDVVFFFNFPLASKTDDVKQA